MSFTAYVIPIFIAIIIIAGFIKKVDVFDEFIQGAKENLITGIEILPTLIALMTAIGMFKASGAVDYITDFVSPITDKIGFPSECIPLALIRPVSGSGALAVYESILNQYGADSFAGIAASIIMGSTETTFYTIAVYFGVTKIKELRHTAACALIGDLTGFIFGVLLARIFFF